MVFLSLALGCLPVKSALLVEYARIERGVMQSHSCQIGFPTTNIGSCSYGDNISYITWAHSQTLLHTLNALVIKSESSIMHLCCTEERNSSTSPLGWPNQERIKIWTLYFILPMSSVIHVSIVWAWIGAWLVNLSSCLYLCVWLSVSVLIKGLCSAFTEQHRII